MRRFVASHSSRDSQIVNRPRVLVLGAGRRVKNDVIPSLIHLGYSRAELMIVRKNSSQLKDYPQFSCIQFDPKSIFEFNPEYVISCLPPEISSTLIKQVLRCSHPHALLIDTPIKKNAEFLKSLQLPGGVFVIEDNHLVYFARQMRELKPDLKVLILRKSFYDYHGIAFLASTLGPISHFRIKIRVRRFLFLSFFAGSTLIFWIGPRNYSKGEIYALRLNRVKKGFSKLVFDSEYLSSEEKELATNHFGLDESKRVIGENPIRNMLFWKRVGLTKALGGFLLANRNEFISVRDAVRNEDFFIG